MMLIIWESVLVWEQAVNEKPLNFPPIKDKEMEAWGSCDSPGVLQHIMELMVLETCHQGSSYPRRNPRGKGEPELRGMPNN